MHASTTMYIFTKMPEPETHVGEKFPSLTNVLRTPDIRAEKKTMRALFLPLDRN